MGSTETEPLSEWFASFLEFIRENDLTNNYWYEHFEAPCQIEVFWVDEPVEGQLVLITNDEERSDKKITINGPFNTNNFIDETTNIIASDRWQRSVSPSETTTAIDEPVPRAEMLAQAIRDFKNEMENSLFRGDYGFPTTVSNKRLWEQGHYFTNIGSITEYEMTDLINPFLASNEIQDDLFPDDDPSISTETEVMGGYIRDPVWVDKSPEISFQNMIFANWGYGSHSIFEYNLFDLELYVRRDGLMLLERVDKDVIQGILNLFLGIGLFLGFRSWRSILDRHMVTGGVTNDRITSWGVPDGVPELQGSDILVETHHERDILPINDLEYLIDIVEFTYPIDQLRELVKLHLQAHTHLLDEEFRAAFVLNWTAVEQILDIFLTQNINQDYDIDWKGEELEYASISDSISHSEYLILDEYREKRNTVIHDMDGVSVHDAEKLDLLVSKLIVREINQYIEDRDISSIEFEPYPVMISNQSSENNQTFEDI